MTLALAPAARPGLLARFGAAATGPLALQQGRRAPWLAVAMGAGILAYFDRTTEPGLAALAVVPPLLLLAILAGRWARWAGWALALPAAGLLGFGIAAWQAGRQPPPLVLPATAVVVSGLVAEVQPLPEGQRVTLAGARIGEAPPAERSLRIRLRAEDPARPMPGDRLTVRALLREPGAPAAPGAWDFQRAAFFSGLGGSGFALAAATVEPGAGEAPPLAGLRARLDRQVGAAIPGPAGAVSAALLTGTQSAIPPAEMVAMRDSGLAHLLSVSGLHMAIVIGVVFAALRILLAAIPWVALRLPGKPVAAVAALLAGAFYMLLTGSQVPMQRCLAMAALVTLALLTGRRALSPRALALAAVVVMLLAPAEVLGPSFQMSFAAVLALIAGHEALGPRLSALRQRHPGLLLRAGMMLLGVALTSVLAGLATAPFGLHHFGRLQVYGVAANALAVPITSFWVMPAGLLAMLLLPLGLEAWPLAVMGWGVEAILAVARLVAAWPGAAPALPLLPGWGLALATFGFCWLCLWRGRVRLLGLPTILAGLLAGQVTPPPDLLVSADGRMVALRTDQGVYLHRMPGASAFTREIWARHFGVAGFLTLPETGAAADGALLCTPAACRFRPSPDSAEVALLRSAPPPRAAPGQIRRGTPPDAAALAEACGQVALLVASEPIRPRCPSGLSIDRFTVWRDGAQAVWLAEGAARVLSDRAARGLRPWVPPPPLPGRPEPLPLAPRDEGGAGPALAAQDSAPR